MTHSQMELKLNLSNAFGPFFSQFLTLFFGNWSNKNAFQWDAYLPLVDHIPACTGQRGCIPTCIGQGCLPRGVSGQGGVWLRWGVWPRGGCLAKRGVSGQGECLARGMSARGVSAQGGVADTP